jgi:hypothetical protein
MFSDHSGNTFEIINKNVVFLNNLRFQKEIQRGIGKYFQLNENENASEFVDAIYIVLKGKIYSSECLY